MLNRARLRPPPENGPLHRSGVHPDLTLARALCRADATQPAAVGVRGRRGISSSARRDTLPNYL